jgi:hypothetical protein
MRVTGLSEEQAIAIVDRVSRDLYDGNIIVRESRAVSRQSCRISLRTRDSRAHGARYAPSGRHCLAVSWEGFRDVIRAFLEEGATRVRTSIADYTPANFEDEYPRTAWQNVGSQLFPVAIRELTL